MMPVASSGVPYVGTRPRKNRIGKSMFARLSASSSVTLALMLACGSVQADDNFKCVDEHGGVTYTNVGTGKGCTKIAVDPVVIPGFKAPTKAGPTPAGFPKVDNSTQKARDSDRKRILEDELHDKEAQLAVLKREYNNGEPERQGDERNYQRYLDRTERLKSDIARAESDIASIRNEIGKVQ
jgi:hypothetical protein